MIFDLIQDINQDCSFTNSIQESKFTERLNKNKTEDIPLYTTIVSCILSVYDQLYNHLPNNEKEFYMKKKLIEICSNIEEKSDTCYTNFNFSKLMKPSLIQQGIQLSEKNKNMISSIYYLNELYKKHFVLVINNRAYKTCIKNYPEVYIVYQSNKFYCSMNKNQSWEYDTYENLFKNNFIQDDIRKSYTYIYKMPLFPINKYKIDELKKIAIESKISLKDGTKNKVKQVLYDEINLFLINR
tara:strand:- start:327 stop:1049 length:723 start_codon:yes stop_codon:yes gene_type:complete